jgi:hypothetical protein
MGILDNAGAEGVKYAYTKWGKANPFPVQGDMCTTRRRFFAA